MILRAGQVDTCQRRATVRQKSNKRCSTPNHNGSARVSSQLAAGMQAQGLNWCSEMISCCDSATTNLLAQQCLQHPTTSVLVAG